MWAKRDSHLAKPRSNCASVFTSEGRAWAAPAARASREARKGSLMRGLGLADVRARHIVVAKRRPSCNRVCVARSGRWHRAGDGRAAAEGGRADQAFAHFVDADEFGVAGALGQLAR